MYLFKCHQIQWEGVIMHTLNFEHHIQGILWIPLNHDVFLHIT